MMQADPTPKREVNAKATRKAEYNPNAWGPEYRRFLQRRNAELKEEDPGSGWRARHKKVAAEWREVHREVHQQKRPDRVTRALAGPGCASATAGGVADNLCSVEHVAFRFSFFGLGSWGRGLYATQHSKTF